MVVLYLSSLKGRELLESGSLTPLFASVCVSVCGAIFIDDSYMHKSGICTIRLVRARLRVDSFSSLYTFACVTFGNWC